MQNGLSNNPGFELLDPLGTRYTGLFESLLMLEKRYKGGIGTHENGRALP